MADRIVSAEEVTTVRGYTSNVVRAVRENSSVSFVPCVELNSDYEAMSRAVLSGTLTVTGATAASGLRTTDVETREARRVAELSETRSR